MSSGKKQKFLKFSKKLQIFYVKFFLNVFFFTEVEKLNINKQNFSDGL